MIRRLGWVGIAPVVLAAVTLFSGTSDAADKTKVD